MVFADLESPVTAAASPKLFRGVVTSPDLELPLTCGSLQATRLAWLRGTVFAFASGTTVHTVDAGGGSCVPGALSGLLGGGGPLGSELADDYLVPRALGGLRAARVAAHSVHRLEVQALVAGGGLLASTDGYGRTVLSRADAPGCGVLALTPPDLSAGAAGWAGAALAPGGGACVAVARAGFRDVVVFDDDVVVRRFRTVLPPRAVVLRAGGALAVAEGAFVTLYDARARGTRPAAQRRVAADGALRALADAGPMLLAAGDDRAVHALDPYTLAPRGRWARCLKYEPAALVPAGGAAAAAVASVDNEVAVGGYAEQDACAQTPRERTKMLSGAAALAGGARRRCGFRADVRVIGLARAGNGDLATMSETGALYVLRGT